MIIVRLVGGLGNQLFEYAAGRAVSLRTGAPLRLDISAYAKDSAREFRLDRFGIQATIASDVEIRAFLGPGLRSPRTRAWLLLQRLLPYSRRTIVLERGHPFNRGLLEVSDRVYLVGYWQSERYFAQAAEVLRRELVVTASMDPANEEMARRIEACQSVSLHIRRGDYVTNPLYGGICTPDYYRQAAARIASVVDSPRLFVFSDDMGWVRSNLLLDLPMTFVTQNDASHDYEDLRLMSMCKHHIMANSSFSWWGAWLRDSPEEIVIAPRKWFNDPSRDTRDLLPDRWQRI